MSRGLGRTKSLTRGNDERVHTNPGSFWKHAHKPVLLSWCVLQTYKDRIAKCPASTCKAKGTEQSPCPASL